MKKWKFREVRHVAQNTRKEAAELESEHQACLTSMSFLFHKAATSISQEKCKCHSSSSHTKYSKTRTKSLGH